MFQFLRLSTKFLAVLRLSVNPIETPFGGKQIYHLIQNNFNLIMYVH